MTHSIIKDNQNNTQQHSIKNKVWGDQKNGMAPNQQATLYSQLNGI